MLTVTVTVAVLNFSRDARPPLNLRTRMIWNWPTR